jgi:CheY-like chemotaxis protein
VARACQVSPATVASWIDQGHLKGHKTPTGHRRVVADDLAAFMRAHGMQVPSELVPERGRPVVVLIEDDAAYRRTLQAHVARHALEFELVEAETGVDGLLEIGRREPALIVIDYGLPDLNAEQVVERLRGRGVRTEVLVVSGGMPAEAQERLRAAGVTAVLGKGAGLAAVVTAITQALARRAAA